MEEGVLTSGQYASQLEQFERIQERINAANEYAISNYNAENEQAAQKIESNTAMAQTGAELNAQIKEEYPLWVTPNFSGHVPSLRGVRVSKVIFKDAIFAVNLQQNSKNLGYFAILCDDFAGNLQRFQAKKAIKKPR